MEYKAIDELGEVRKRSGISYYHQLYTLLSTALNNGFITAGSALPSESELMERFGVSRNTVRRALGQLEQEKRIVRRRGSGSYARRVSVAELPSESIAEVLHDFGGGKTHASRLLRVQSSPTPEFIRRRDPEFGEKSMLVQRCRSYNNQPFMFSTSYVPEHLSTRLTRRQLSRRVVLAALDEFGVEPSTADQTTTAVLADTYTARHLGVEAASALLCIHRLIRDATGRSIEHQSHLYRPDRCQLRVALRIDRSPAGVRWAESESPRMPAEL
jgi:GntR family transcriptional regulator